MITVIIICANEEANIGRALSSVRWCDNVVVVDSYSLDRTEAICRSFPNVTFLQHPFENFAQQRQYALTCGSVKHPWVLALDADESVTAELRDELIDIANRYVHGQPVAYDIAMRLIMWGKWLRHSSEYPIYWRRFIHVEHCRFVQEGHADKVIANGMVGTARHDLIHDDARGLGHWLDKHNRYTTQEASFALNELCKVPMRHLISRDRMQRRRALKKLFRRLPFNGLIRFVYLFVFKLGFLDGVKGYEFCQLRAMQHFIVRLKIKEMLVQKERVLESDAISSR